MEKQMLNDVNNTSDFWDELFEGTKTVVIDIVNTGKRRVKKSNIINLESDNASEIEIVPFEGIIDILGDKSVWAVPTPGHTSGSLSYLMKTNDGIVLFVGDACTEMGVDNDIGPGSYSKDIGLAEDTMLKIKELILNYPKVKLICTHEI